MKLSAVSFRDIMLFAVISVSALFTGCTHFTSPARSEVIDDTKSYWFDYNSDRRGALMIAKKAGGDDFRYCAEPSPDTAAKMIETLTAKGAFKEPTTGMDVSGEFQAGFNSEVVQLTKRTQTVLFLRESLYRLCELSMNRNINDKDAVEMYKMVIEAALKLAVADALKTEADKIAETNKLLEKFKDEGIRNKILKSLGISGSPLE